MLDRNVFYRRFGVRKGTQITSPPLAKFDLFAFPQQAIFHYVGKGALDKGPIPTDFMYSKVTHSIYVGHITTIGDVKGNPRTKPLLPDTMIRKYHQTNRRFKRLINLESANRDNNNLLIMNYALMPNFYVYPRTLFSSYNEWWNSQAAVWKNIEALCAETQRDHFIPFSLPKILPSLSDLQIGARGVTQQLVKKFNTPESLFFLEVWKWLGNYRADSVLSNLKLENFNKVNLICQESGYWFVINLGLLDSWRKATKAELEVNPKLNEKGIEADTIARGFLRLAIRLFEVRTKDQVEKEGSAPELSGTKEETPVGQIQIPIVVGTPDEDGVSDTADTIKDSHFDDTALDSDLEALEIITKTVADKNDSTVKEVIESAPYSLENGIRNKCDLMAEAGQLSATQYRHYNTIAAAYKTLPAPDGKGTLANFITINPEDTQIVQSKSISDIAAVTDKTMLKSSLLTFDSDYIKNIMQKDVAGMALAIQNAGMAVTSYEVERIEDVMGSFDTYTMRVSPVEGASSTIRFKLPVLAEDGTYTANGTKYRMRKQRGELPIRKIAPDRVALSSYYGKAFVSRSDKRVNNYNLWLSNKIRALGLDETSVAVTAMYPADVFDNKFPAPRLYSGLAMYYRAFTIKTEQGDFELNFDHTKREELYSKEILDMYEKDGMIIFGVSPSKNDFLIVDNNDAIYSGDRFGKLAELGYLDNLIGLPSDAPVDIAELRVMGKNVPIGIVLGYELGLERLMSLLGVTPRRVDSGARRNMLDSEYALVFHDETLIFSKLDKKASLILGGFNEYHRSIYEYSVYEFDKPGVYLNILDSVGIGVRYLREVDLMYQMFIDPITRELLVDMHEPTDFRGLLLRSCEMLMIDQHPDAFDSRFMRTKGYERMAGAVYSEIVKSVRAHGGRVGKAKQPLDFNPHVVWKNISQDPSIALVNDINPIENLKAQEAVTFSGTGGRNSRSMTKETRIYHENDMGTISEATVDSSDVAINTYTSADPQFSSLRGLSKPYKIGETGITALVSTSALISPGADRDD